MFISQMWEIEVTELAGLRRLRCKLVQVATSSGRAQAHWYLAKHPVVLKAMLPLHSFRKPQPFTISAQRYTRMHRCPCPPAAGNDANLDVGLGDIKPHGMAHDADLALDDADLAALDDELAADDNIILVDDDDDDIMHDDAAIDEIALQAALLAQRGPAAWTNVDDEEDGEHVSSSGNDDEFDPSQQAADEDFWSDDLERVYLVGVSMKGGHGQQMNQQQQQHREGSAASKRQHVFDVHESMEELARLADTAGLKVVGSTYQALESPNNATYIGSGKVAEVARAVRALRVETVIFDDELSPGQARNLEKALRGSNNKEEPELQVKVCDRTALILDIFSQRANTREGKLQVELAQTEYQLPRLTRMWTHLDRVAGGGQVKGTGEKQIEIDKRLLRDKAAALRRELESVRTHRAAYRSRRSDAAVPVVALVGYTNAGKSTLLNTLTSAGVLAEDKLFATLDPTTRKVRLPGNLEMLLSDTVGFIQKLPTQLVAAFRATLEEIAEASVVLHVLDVSAPNAAAQCDAVLQVGSAAMQYCAYMTSVLEWQEVV
eukprot:jgi/Chrzof1/10303/Cz04g36170.t1